MVISAECRYCDQGFFQPNLMGVVLNSTRSSSWGGKLNKDKRVSKVQGGQALHTAWCLCLQFKFYSQIDWEYFYTSTRSSLRSRWTNWTRTRGRSSCWWSISSYAWWKCLLINLFSQTQLEIVPNQGWPIVPFLPIVIVIVDNFTDSIDSNR